ncbi:hypothetical protein BREVNS_0996 [Brevinematales bacterium NS]|jgi:hypothetical protein|nr:hypothetical protein [Brevinematales bacterium]QJR21746.1 hypothetical protein BREVNS_0996 [Brevinematales bacterium NS]
MKKELLLYILILAIEGLSFFMGIGFVLVMYRVFGPLVRYLWLIGLGWVALFSLVSFVPIREILNKIKS